MIGPALRRRTLVAGLAAGALAGQARAAVADSLPVPAGGALAFRIMREGTRIGTHSLGFTANGADLTVRCDVEIVVHFLAVPVFRYTHHNIERWHGGQLMGFDAQTDHDGTPLRASARREAQGLVVQGSKATPDDRPGSYVAPAASIDGTHWNRRELDAPIINPETGRLDHPTVRDAGMAQVPLANGGSVAARRYVLSGDVRLELFYAEDGAWTGLAFTGDDGSRVSYERL